MDRKICPDCKRKYALEDDTCIDCGSKLIVEEVLDPGEWLIAYHEIVRENVDTIAADLAAHGVEGRVRYIDLSKFNVSLTSSSTWALLVPKENAEAAAETLHKLYGYTEEAEEEDIEALGEEYGFLQAPVDELAEDQPNWPMLCGAIRDTDLPGSLAEKARDALIAAGADAEENVLQALDSEIREDHYATRTWSFELLIEILGEIATENTAARLLGLCADEDSTVRINALHCLGTLGAPEHADALLPLLEDLDADVRQEADSALEEITGESAWSDYILSTADGSHARKAWEKALGARHG